MGHLYYTRHGQTIWNVEKKVCGATDIALTELGHEQAKELGRIILAKQLPIDEILYSPLSRATDTAKHVHEITNIPMRMETRLTEQNFGKYESTAREGDDFLQAKSQFCYRFDGGESMVQVAQRIYNLLDEIKQQDKTYLFVAHNGLARVVRSYFYDMTNEEYAAFRIHNCEIVEYSW